MLMAIILFIIGLALLIVFGDFFVDGAVGIAKKYHVPELLIGATVVSIGTTLPEVLVSATSAVSGHGEIAYGNAIGSIICNTSLIAAITIAIKPSIIDKKSIFKPVIFFFIAAIFYSLVAITTGEFSRLVGFILLGIFLVYMIITIRESFLKSKMQVAEALQEKSKIEDKGDKKEQTLFQSILLIVLGAAGIALGARLLVDNGTIIAKELGVPESVIGLTIVALGTSLPELVTAIFSLVKGHGALSVGNIIGANLFNLVLVSGVSVSLSPFSVPTEKTLLGINASFIVDIPLMFLVMLIMTLPALIKGKLSRWQGIALLVIYAGFCVFQFA